MTTDELVDRLASHRTIGSAPREELHWIATHAVLRRFQPGEIVTHHTEAVKALYILLSGRITMTRGGQQVMEWHGGDVTGILPYSRLVNPPGDSIAEEPVEAVTIDRNELAQMTHNCYEVTAILVHVMTDRARQFTSADLRNEKMISLGKLAAGLAHELNNPASAAMRDAKSMAQMLDTAEQAARGLGGAGLTAAQLAELDRVHELCMATAAPRVSGLDLADREEEIAAWLEGQRVDPGIAEDLARTPVTRSTLASLAGVVRGKDLEASLRWLAAGCAARSLAVDLERAATRIHALVSAVKGFTHMDRDPSRGPVDLRGGITDTVAILEGKARAKSVAITLDFARDIPPVQGISAEINQIWMNLIDNAIAAAPARGRVTVTAACEGRTVFVRVVDDGPGIAPDIREKIFDPFFTTKPVGEGTGLGLDIVRRIVGWHNGRIDVTSEPGRTEFCVSLPLP